ncbi:glycoside hydrolase family 43 protein [Algibacter lectus]|uniref:Beta-xylosidase n=1 Tax=Algibacter lectus TaxID=221126 RepID=A0A4R8MHL9_9FLAO|nr:glycoside hydrolase 43 family protein [Algibacter lectus]MWW23258.1 family 43 glycosylhydrolase [Algibacter lectus]TDY64067.1 beta-xylosidase [Algibacter lectus]
MLLKLKYVLPILFCCFFSCADKQSNENEKPITGSWGDQGDGTYKNPILNADYPDVDVEKVGDTYYMISSKQHMSPGMVILESKDMVNWTTVGHVWESLSWVKKYDWNQMNGYALGVWAGDLAYHDGTWYCYVIDRNYGLFMSSAKDIRGPWTEPHLMLPPNEVLDDPAVYWDEENHQAYMICNTGKFKKSRENTAEGNENRLYKMSWDGKEILDSGEVIYTGPGAEAAKIYNINDTWYILMGEWYVKKPRRSKKIDSPENDRKQIVLRSTTNSIYGPYEKKIVFERGNGIERSCSQGALMQAPDNTWWYTHQLIQNIATPFQGRPQLLQPVNWVDGWPIIGEDIDNDGIGEPVLQHKKPIQGFPIDAPSTDDDFSNTTLGRQWEWNHNPRNSHWSLTERPGWLRLKASMPLPEETTNGPGNNNWSESTGTTFPFWRASNTISQRIMGNTTGAAVAKFDISQMAIGQRAGFVRFGGVYHVLGIYVDNLGGRNLFYVNKDGEETKGPKIKSNDLFIRTSNTGNQAYFEYSLDGNKYEKFGPQFTLKFGNWTGDRLGFFCWNDKEDQGVIDIDWFTYDYDGPKGVYKK